MKAIGPIAGSIRMAGVGVVLLAWSVLAGADSSDRSDLYRAVNESVFSRAILISDRKMNGAYLYLVFPAGESANPFDEGLAHYVEHLAWLSAFADAKDKERHSNAWTDHFSTGYWKKAGEDDLHDALRTLISVADPLSVESDFALQERDIVLREYDFRIRERPLYPVHREMAKIVYGKGTLARSLIGEPSVIARYSPADAKSLHRQSHVLADATLLVYGDVAEEGFESALASLSEVAGADRKPTLSTLPASTDASPRVSNRPVEDGIIADDAFLSLPGLAEDIFLYRKLIPLSGCEDTIAHCEMMARIAEAALESSLPGGLAGPLKFDDFVARSFFLDIDWIGDSHLQIRFAAHPDRGVALEDLQGIFEAEIKTTLENGLPRKSYESVLSRIEKRLRLFSGRDRPDYNRRLALGRLVSGKAMISWSDQVEALERMTLPEVNLFLKSLLADGREATRRVAAGSP